LGSSQTREDTSFETDVTFEVDVTPVADAGTGYADGCADGDVDAPPTLTEHDVSCFAPSTITSTENPPSTLTEHDVSIIAPLTTPTKNFEANKVACTTNSEPGHVRPSTEAVAAESSAVSTEPDVDREASPFEEDGPEASLSEII
jgi:hypothetical protein